MFSDLIKEKLKSLPASSGVYIMLDESGEIIYIGKARVLKNRVRQYFQNSDKPVKVEAMVAKIADFRYIITESEVDALLLENNLIKEHKPYYNILLKFYSHPEISGMVSELASVERKTPIEAVFSSPPYSFERMTEKTAAGIPAIKTGIPRTMGSRSKGSKQR